MKGERFIYRQHRGGFVVQVPGFDGKKRTRRAKTIVEARRVRDALVRGLKVALQPQHGPAEIGGLIGYMAGTIAALVEQSERDCPNPDRCELRRQAWRALSLAGWKSMDLRRLFTPSHGRRVR